jgi:allantoinase
MPATDLVIRGRRVFANRRLGPAAIHVADGRVAAVTAYDEVEPGAPLHDAGERLVTPGLVDSHVHVNEPGRAEWEGFACATAAAAAGGVTTIVDMPLNCIPATTSSAAAEAKRAALEGQAHVDVALWGGLVPGGAAAIDELAAFGVAGIKCFLCPSGVDEFPHVGRADLEQALPRLAALGLPLLVHAESPATLARAAAALDAARPDPRAHATWLAARPAEAEVEAVAMLVDLARRHRAAIHVVHVASAAVPPMIAAARAEGLAVSGEACPHHLTFAAEEIPDRATAFKCAPPIRGAADREALWGALAEGALDLVASDHSPCPPAHRLPERGDFLTAWGGIAGLETLLAALWTGASARGHDLAAMLRWGAERPARLAGLDRRKGRLDVGFDADLVIWDDGATFVVEPQRLHSRHAVTPFAGRALRGVVHQTWVRGTRAFDRAAGLGRPAGRFVPARGTRTLSDLHR